MRAGESSTPEGILRGSVSPVARNFTFVPPTSIDRIFEGGRAGLPCLVAMVPGAAIRVLMSSPGDGEAARSRRALQRPCAAMSARSLRAQFDEPGSAERKL